ncbi:MAG: YceI family protein [Candidatus Sumerlaeaceae bacterium]
MRHYGRFSTLTILAVITCSSAFAAAETYKVDPVHSSVIYKIRHMNVTNFYGRFNDIQGTISMDEAAPETGSINIEIKADSLDSGNQKRDEHVKGPDFLNTKQFPSITFKSTSMKKTGDKQLDVTGDLNFHGVTRPITAKLELIGKGKNPRMGEIAGGEATFTFKRSDYGMNFMMQGLGDEIGVIVGIEAVKQGTAPPTQ